jgi:hypothetical protein
LYWNDREISWEVWRFEECQKQGYWNGHKIVFTLDWSAESGFVDERDVVDYAIWCEGWAWGQFVFGDSKHLNWQSTYLINEYNQKLVVEDPWESGLFDE